VALLDVKDLSIEFSGLKAVQHLDFSVEKGEIFGLIGPNGAGKTTVFNMVSGFFKPSGGQIFLNGMRIDGKFMFEINKLGIARTYQNINLFNNISVMDNMLIGQHCRIPYGTFASFFHTRKYRDCERATREKARETLGFVGIPEREDDQAKALSYGEQRLLEIARALVSDPCLLLLDEPAAGMNPTEKDNLARLVLEIRKRGVTVLCVEHDMKFVMGITDRICVLNYGQRIALGTPGEMQRHPAVVEAYLGGGE
jgi:branched-chain amino acid transport system ATP-binding protein